MFQYATCATWCAGELTFILMIDELQLLSQQAGKVGIPAADSLARSFLHTIRSYMTEGSSILSPALRQKVAMLPIAAGSCWLVVAACGCVSSTPVMLEAARPLQIGHHERPCNQADLFLWTVWHNASSYVDFQAALMECKHCACLHAKPTRPARQFPAT